MKVAKMGSRGFSALAALIFLGVAAAQGYRAYLALPVVIGTFEVPVIASWGACGVLTLLALVGLRASGR
jgi:hypothetical protein